eukprot:GHVT01034129.1.p1 GENE.GHVT01034129.1~~GHVT01034129.1.p1  ORF type:complete len:214 (-),score=22.68 GHVT01034129.1:349-990(-)
MSIYKKLLEVNFLGYAYCAKHAWPYLKARHGQTVVLSSLSGEVGLPLRSAYCASKFAVTGFFEALRIEQGDKVAITICCPPSVRTPLREHSLRPKEARTDHSQIKKKRIAEGALDVRAADASNDCETSSRRREASSWMELQHVGEKDRDWADPGDAQEADKMMSVKDCVDYVMLAADKRARKVTFPLSSYLAIYLRPLVPDVVDQLLKAASKL